VVDALGRGEVKVVPDVLVSGGGGAFEGLAAALMGMIQDGSWDRRNNHRNGDEAPKEPVLMPVDTEREA
jgi:hypothetical protein